MPRSAPARPPALTAARLVPLLAEQGIAAPGLHIEPHAQSGRNRVFTIRQEPGPGRWLAKQGFSATNAEPWFYAAHPHLPFIPRCLLAQPSQNLIIIDYLDAPSLQRLAATEPLAVLPTLARLGEPLAQIHHLHPLPTNAPPAYLPLPSLDPVDGDLLITSSPAAYSFIERLQARRRLRACLRRAYSLPGPRGLIHADLKPDNILLTNQPILIDWELAGIGPLGWDLGSLIGAMILHWAHHLELNRTTDPTDWINQSPIPFTDLHHAARTLLTNYLAQSTGPVPKRTLVASYAAAWLLSRVLVETAQLHALNARHLLLLNIAEGLYADPFELFGDLTW
jgi:hypothetical protein